MYKLLFVVALALACALAEPEADPVYAYRVVSPYYAGYATGYRFRNYAGYYGGVHPYYGYYGYAKRSAEAEPEADAEAEPAYPYALGSAYPRSGYYGYPYIRPHTYTLPAEPYYGLYGYAKRSAEAEPYYPYSGYGYSGYGYLGYGYRRGAYYGYPRGYFRRF